MRRLHALLLAPAIVAAGELWLEGRPLLEWNAAANAGRGEMTADWRQVTGQHRLWDQAWLERANAVVHFEQLTPIFERLEAGQPLAVVGLGSSVLATNGGCFNDRSQMYQHVRHVRERLNPEKCQPHGWVGSVMADLNRTWPHADHLYVDLGQPGGDIAQYARHWCFSGTLPREIDLVVVEDYGGAQWYAERGKHVEQVFVQLAHRGRGGGPPAFVFVTSAFVVDIWREPWKTTVPVERFIECLQTRCANASACFDFATSLLTPRTSSTYGDGGEDSFSAVMHAYGFSVLSVRNAFVSALRDASWGMSHCDLAWLFYQDAIHPSPAGELFYADVLLNHLQAGLAWYRRAAASPTGMAAHRRLTPRQPVNEGAWRIPLRRCYSVETSLGIPVVAERSHGWAWAEETRPGHVGKPGWLTTAAGSVLTIELSTHLGGAPEAVLTVTYLESYEAMGTATLRCVERCACAQLHLNGLHASHASVETFAQVNISQTTGCVLVLSNTSPDGLKWKLLGLSVEAVVEP